MSSPPKKNTPPRKSANNKQKKLPNLPNSIITDILELHARLKNFNNSINRLKRHNIQNENNRNTLINRILKIRIANINNKTREIIEITLDLYLNYLNLKSRLKTKSLVKMPEFSKIVGVIEKTNTNNKDTNNIIEELGILRDMIRWPGKQAKLIQKINPKLSFFNNNNNNNSFLRLKYELFVVDVLKKFISKKGSFEQMIRNF